MSAAIQDFIKSFSTSELARPSRFTVALNNISYGGIASKDLILRCESAELPSITYATTEQKFGSNPIEKFPYQVEFNDVNLTFIVSENMNEKIFFDAWMDAVSPSNNYNFNYKTGTGGYSTDVMITQYDLTDKITYSVTLKEAYPITVNQLDLDWSAEGYHKLAVVLAYTYWTKN